jgi:hypothetical protein
MRLIKLATSIRSMQSGLKRGITRVADAMNQPPPRMGGIACGQWFP